MPHPKLLSSLSQISFSFPIRIVPIFGESFFPRSIYTISKIFDFVGNNRQSLTADSDLKNQTRFQIYGSVWTYLSFQFQMNLRKKEKYANYSKSIWRNPFCCCSNVSNDDVISYNLKGWVWEWVWTGWAPGMDFRGQVWKRGCEKWHFLKSKIGSGFGEPGGTPPPIIPTG